MKEADRHIEQGLVIRIDRTTIDWIFKKYDPQMVVFAHSLLGGRNDTWNIAQDLVSQFWENLWPVKEKYQFNNDSALAGFLRRSVNNLVIDYTRGLGTKRRFEAEYRSVIETEEEPFDARKKWLEVEVVALLDAAIEKLPKAQKKAVLYKLEGKETREIANLTGKSEATIRKDLTRARAFLAGRLEENIGVAMVATILGILHTDLLQHPTAAMSSLVS
ncbi:RNA polymerase sigma factor [Dinghuibacter silviterrae]|uniref:RNA polymerase sigma factor (Sigma-70 family) n=1 Tax=Dinghuibacter silviterrae TaxID=1539049 RepID=A0A4R8DTM0_9BACT|nr:RNA polymerase sigma factor [Dinghuibacter silviterrae]TDX00481.1 RNA polymerase sigma factor (sigma-70 family) [Dinghuibacter silviterrae]